MTYTVFLRVASRCVNITMSAFVIGETTNNKRYSTQLKTRVWIVSGKFFKYENILTGCESEAPDCPCKVGIAPLYRNSLCASQHCRLLFQVQEIVHRKMRCTLIFGLNCSGRVLYIQLNHWFLVVSSFGSPNKVLSLSQRNTASPGHGAGGSNNTTARIIVPPSFFA